MTAQSAVYYKGRAAGASATTALYKGYTIKVICDDGAWIARFKKRGDAVMETLRGYCDFSDDAIHCAKLAIDKRMEGWTA